MLAKNLAACSVLGWMSVLALACAVDGRGQLPGDTGLDDVGEVDGGDADGATPMALDRLWFVGDSLMVGAEPHVRNVYHDAESLSFRGLVGASIQNRMPHIHAAAADGADAIVIQAGINNVGGGYINVASLRSAIADAMDAVGEVPCVVWPTYLTQYVRGSYTALGAPKSSLGGMSVSEKLNQLIREEAELRDNVHVADFQPLVDEHPYEWVSTDGLHLSRTGYRELSALYRATMEAACR